MPATISYVASVLAAAGPKVAFAETFEVEAYNRLSVTVKANTSSAKVSLGTADSTLRLMLVDSTKYHASDVTFHIDDENTKNFVLDMPMLIAGQAAVALLGTTAPASLTFKNDLDEDITVNIFIARDPTP